MDKKLLKRIPKKYHAAIYDVWEDEDGFWFKIKEDSGWKLENYYSDYTVHEDSFKEVLEVIKQSLKKVA